MLGLKNLVILSTVDIVSHHLVTLAAAGSAGFDYLGRIPSITYLGINQLHLVSVSILVRSLDSLRRVHQISPLGLFAIIVIIKSTLVLRPHASTYHRPKKHWNNNKVSNEMSLGDGLKGPHYLHQWQ
jgi:hypothetical protein